MSVRSRWRAVITRPHLALIALVGMIVPRRLRGDWRQEWEAELDSRERLFAERDRLDRGDRLELLKRSSSAFWDALSLQRQRREDEMIQDLRFAIRMFVRDPALTAVAVATLALGIGANTAVFSFANALLLRPLGGVAEPDRLVQIGRQYPDRPYLSDSSYPDYLDYRAQNSVLDGPAVVVPTAFHVSSGRGTERVDGELVSGNYFDVLGVTAARGRLITPADDENASAELVAVLSYRLWQRRFGSDESIVGTRIKLDGRDVVVIGVASERFSGTRIGSPRDVWVPLLTIRQTAPRLAERLSQHRPSWLEMFARLKPGITVEQARAQLSTIAARWYAELPATAVRPAVGIERGLGRDADVRRELKRFAYLPFAAVGIVLLIACANVAGLLLARASGRQREIATRLALGAGRIRIVRQLLAESLTLALAGGLAGLVVGRWLTDWLRSLLPERYLFLSFDQDFSGDWRVFLFMLAIATATGIVFGLVPALQGSRSAIVPALKTSGIGRHARRTGVRAVLVVTQVALSLILLVAGGLCVRTMHNAATIDTGYQVQQILTARIDLAKQRYSEPAGRSFQQRLLERLQAVPGVDAAAFAVTLPLNDSRFEDAVYREGDQTRFQSFQNIISPQYFRTMSIPVIAGRGFSGEDDVASPGVAIVNQTLAARLWTAGNPVGKRVTVNHRLVDVIGVVRDIKGRNLFEAPGPMVYLPLLQEYHPGTVLHVRAAVPSLDLAGIVRREVQAFDSDLPVYAVKMLDEHLAATLTPQRLTAHVLSAFSGLALMLAVIGLYGLLAYTVTERRSEIGLRVALGAQRGDVLRLVVVRGMKLALAGVGFGIAAAMGLTPLMKTLLFGVGPLDIATFTAVPVLLLAAALIACYIPARRAARADPRVALRAE